MKSRKASRAHSELGILEIQKAVFRKGQPHLLFTVKKWGTAHVQDPLHNVRVSISTHEFDRAYRSTIINQQAEYDMRFRYIREFCYCLCFMIVVFIVLDRF